CLLIPFATIGPVVGVFVDRWNIKRTMIASDLLRAVLVLLLALASALGWIYVLLFLVGTVSTFFMPAQTAAIRAITPPAGLISANALIQQAVQLVRITAPALAGAMVGWFGAASCYLIDGISFFISAALISTVLIAREPPTPAKGSHPLSITTSDLLVGVKLILTDATLTFAMLTMTAGVFALSCFSPLIAVYVRDELKSGEAVFGAINSLLGIGMIIGTVTIGRFAQRRSKSHLILLGLLAMGGGVLLIGILKNILAASIGMFGTGLGVAFIVVSAQAIVQVHTPAEMIGRVSSSLWALLSVGQLPGLTISGSLAQRIGISYAFYIVAGMLVLMVIFGCFRLPREQYD
ncbi:MAG: MFS transporter, partial [Blastocatellia bacterium]|nr:MFS transporter [Blastocatellia bacterium]